MLNNINFNIDVDSSAREYMKRKTNKREKEISVEEELANQDDSLSTNIDEIEILKGLRHQSPFFKVSSFNFF